MKAQVSQKVRLTIHLLLTRNAIKKLKGCGCQLQGSKLLYQRCVNQYCPQQSHMQTEIKPELWKLVGNHSDGREKQRRGTMEPQGEEVRDSR